MIRGISLLAIGGDAYMWWAVNMACSIKYYSPDVPVQLIASRGIIDKIKAQQLEKVFDYFTEIIEDDYTQNAAFAPGKAKLKLPEYFIFERTIYLDTDGCLIKDITPLFDAPADFGVQLSGSYKLGEEEHPASMRWCASSVLMKYYNLKPTATMPAINSSILLFENTEANQQLYKQACDNFCNNPIPANQRTQTWGRGQGLQPDELYLNVACAQLNRMPYDLTAIHFRPRHNTGKLPEVNELRKTCYGIGLFGNEDLTHVSLKSLYNRHMYSIFLHFFPHKRFTKVEYLMQHKIVNHKF